jgi:hypothetical protein
MSGTHRAFSALDHQKVSCVLSNWCLRTHGLTLKETALEKNDTRHSPRDQRARDGVQMMQTKRSNRMWPGGQGQAMM